MHAKTHMQAYILTLKTIHPLEFNKRKYIVKSEKYAYMKMMKNVEKLKLWNNTDWETHKNSLTQCKVNNFNQNDNDPLRENSTIVLSNVDLISLCNEGKFKEALEQIGRGVSTDYSVFVDRKSVV